MPLDDADSRTYYALNHGYLNKGQLDLAEWRDHWYGMFTILTPKDFEHRLDGLRKAGLPA